MSKIVFVLLSFFFNAHALTSVEVERTWKTVVMAFHNEVETADESIEFVWTKKSITSVAAINYTRPRKIFVSESLLENSALRTDNLVNIFCHELGHVIGGAPYIEEFPGDSRKISTEGQADYFATAKCMKRVLRLNDYSSDFVPTEVKLSLLGRGCETKLCQIVSYISYLTLNSLEDSDRNFSLETSSHEIVDYTFSYKNSSQCRLDTFIAGAICNVSEKLNFSEKNQAKNSCHWRSHDTYFLLGARPICWFRPFTLDSFY